MTTIGFVRHGATDWNRMKKAQGQSDIPLNEEGRWQARMLASRLAQEHWDYIYSSDLSRARETAEIIAAYMGSNVYRYDHRLREKGLGRIEGTTLEERLEKWGDHWESMDHGVEPIDKLLLRSLDILEEMTRNHSGCKILVVSHYSLITITMRHLLNDPTIAGLENSSLSILLKGSAGWENELVNCTKHLVVPT